MLLKVYLFLLINKCDIYICIRASYCIVANAIGVEKSALLAQVLESNLDDKEKTKASKNIQLEFPNGIAECGTDALRFTLLVSLFSPFCHPICYTASY